MVGDARKLVRRSKLYVPVNRENFVAKAWTREADCIILDLEDAIAPGNKASARKLVKDVVAVVKKGGADIQIRINREYEEEDLDACIIPGVICIMIPKCESAEEVQRIDDQVTQLEKERGLPQGSFQFNLAIESAVGVINVESIAKASPRNVQINLGQGDISVNMGFSRLPELNYDQYYYAESKVLYAARAANIQATGLGAQRDVDFTTISSTPEDMFKACRHAYLMGYFGASCIHPAWIKPINEGYRPSEEELNWAYKVKGALEEGYTQGKGSVSVDGRMYDVAHMKIINYILERAEAIERREAEKAKALMAAGYRP